MAGDAVRVVEVGTRDGFQMESRFIATEAKIAVIRGLAEAGLRKLEATSFVSPRAVPQLADAAEVVAAARELPGLELAALVPNARGAERAAAAGVDEMVVFVSASESHNAKNVNRPVAQSLAGVAPIAAVAEGAGIRLHGAVAVAFGCPFEGEVAVEQVLRIVEAYAACGIRSVTLGDTTGMATPPLVRRLLRALRQAVPEVEPVLHFHNTRGIGLVNVAAGLDEGVRSFEAALGGLGGCPFAPGATGNVCTEDLVYLLQECGYDTGIDLDRLVAVAREVEGLVGRPLPGQVMKAGPRLALHDPDAVRTAVG